MINRMIKWTSFILLTTLLASCSHTFSAKKPQKKAPAVEKTEPNRKISSMSSQPLTPVSSSYSPASVQDYECPSQQYSNLIGQNYQNVPKSQLPPYFRTLKPGQSLSMNQSQRTNLYLSNTGQITRITCG